MKQKRNLALICFVRLFPSLGSASQKHVYMANMKYYMGSECALRRSRGLPLRPRFPCTSLHIVPPTPCIAPSPPGLSPPPSLSSWVSIARPLIPTHRICLRGAAANEHALLHSKHACTADYMPWCRSLVQPSAVIGAQETKMSRHISPGFSEKVEVCGPNRPLAKSRTRALLFFQGTPPGLSLNYFKRN